MLKDFTSYSSLVPKFLNFVVKFSRLPSIYDGELRQKHQFFYSSVKNDTRTKKRQYSLTVGNSLLIKSHRKIVKKKDLIPIKQDTTIDTPTRPPTNILRKSISAWSFSSYHICYCLQNFHDMILFKKARYAVKFTIWSDQTNWSERFLKTVLKNTRAFSNLRHP